MPAPRTAAEADLPAASRAGLAVGTVGLLAACAWRASVDLNPPSLWLDDLWVVALARDASLAALLASPASLPPGFAVLVSAALSLIPDIEVGAQAIAFTAGLLAIGGAAALAFRLTRSPLAALCAAAILGLDPTFLSMMARAKPYTTDALCVLLVGWCAIPLFSSFNRSRWWAYTAVVCASAFLSTLSLFVSAATTAGILLGTLRRGLRDRYLLAAASLQLAAAGSVVWLVLRAEGFGDLRGFWQDDFLAARSEASIPNSVATLFAGWLNRLAHAGVVDAGPLPIPVARLAFAVLLCAGLAWLARQRHFGSLAVGATTLVLGIVASVGGYLPIGTPRVDTFLLPFGAVERVAPQRGCEVEARRPLPPVVSHSWCCWRCSYRRRERLTTASK